MEKERSKRHFLLVHGAGHGAWCWYKLTTLLESAGHQVTAVDLAASGVHPKQIEEVGSIHEYVGPLIEVMAALPPAEKVVLVGHSLGGVVVSVAMEAFPEKIAATVFIAAIMPAPHSPASDIQSEFFRRAPPGFWLDSLFHFDQNKLPTSMDIGPGCLSSNLYQLCPPADLRLATTLVRPTRLFTKEELEDGMLTEERFGSVARVYVVCKEDKVLSEDLQRWIIERAPVTEVEEIEGADHMAMLSKPQELSSILLIVAEKYF